MKRRRWISESSEHKWLSSMQTAEVQQQESSNKGTLHPSASEEIERQSAVFTLEANCAHPHRVVSRLMNFGTVIDQRGNIELSSSSCAANDHHDSVTSQACALRFRRGRPPSISSALLLIPLLCTTALGQPSQGPMTILEAPSTVTPVSVAPVSVAPTNATLQAPVITPTIRSSIPTTAPTNNTKPTVVPTDMPSMRPTFLVASDSKGFFRQNFVLPNEKEFFNDSEKEALAEIYESYTILLVLGNTTLSEEDTSDLDRVSTNCTFLRDPVKLEEVLSVDYSCHYNSTIVNVTFFPVLFRAEVNNDLPGLTQAMKNVSIEVESAQETQFVTIPPKTSPEPTHIPTLPPSERGMPSLAPSFSPTNSLSPTFEGGAGLSTGAIIAIVILCGLAVLAGLGVYYRSWTQKLDLGSTSPFSGTGPTGRSSANHPMGGFPESEDSSDRNVLSPTESVLSNKSLLSAGESGLDEDSGDEADNTKNLQDEFDKYKDQNLEKMRADVEVNLSGFEGIMSAAVTNALMGDEETNAVEMQELLWGCDPNPAGTEIEASALFEVSDWLKRNESAGGERKRAFMQEILNKMVTSVRYGVLSAEEASRTIHESAAILGLPLAGELPTTTVLISGMRKTTTALDMTKALKEFGDIDVAAMASGRRGFGIFRFRRNKSVDRALRRYRSGEIVILDVSIQMKVLMPSGAVDSR